MRPPEGRGLRGTCAETEDATLLAVNAAQYLPLVREALAMKQRMQLVLLNQFGSIEQCLRGTGDETEDATYIYGI